MDGQWDDTVNSHDADDAGSEGEEDAKDRVQRLNMQIFPHLLINPLDFLIRYTMTLGSRRSFPLRSLGSTPKGQRFEIFEVSVRSCKLRAIGKNSPPKADAITFEAAYLCPGMLDVYETPATSGFKIPQHTIVQPFTPAGPAPHEILIVGELTDGTLVWNKADDGGIIIAHLRPNPKEAEQNAAQLDFDLTQHGSFGAPTGKILNTFGPSRWNPPPPGTQGRSCFVIGIWIPFNNRGWCLFAQIKNAANQVERVIEL